MKTMKALSIWQPWATMIIKGYKEVETRSWATNYRGLLMICSSKKQSKQLEEFFTQELKPLCPNILEYKNFLFGYALGFVELYDCQLMTPELIAQQSERELKMGNWEAGRYAWKLRNRNTLTEKFPVIGKQGLFNLEY